MAILRKSQQRQYDWEGLRREELDRVLWRQAFGRRRDAQGREAWTDDQLDRHLLPIWDRVAPPPQTQDQET